ncbi:MAG: 4Fe-4S binding protein [Candidatus Woesearchaeota archaeon]|jgi:pyruvate ferredoxin oxidoreductase delta subunit|nr:4Fe-4S binding protein [Candidatus Woesearchaeota archaeon]MDP7506057.1 4Fe-4S binding protein [Candidatus Woesearchaeota archaeon]MDP7610528.1 4Fe-4S binding protein [Candidatus Woesearchaeota archaeon]|tara:strand:- start:217 stop:480 length:264 start_codon:yes stop_codon:yes gene_type:complete
MKITIGAVVTEPGSTVKNKTSGWRSFKPVWDVKKCTQCGLCGMYCPDMSIPTIKGKRSETDLDYCKGCLICVQVCPVKAITAEKEEK